MILGDLFESRMSELDIEYQDYKNLEPVAFYSRYKMTKDEWASKNWSLIKGSETVHEMDKSQPGQQRHGDYSLGAKGTNVKPVTPKKLVKDLTKDLDQAFAKEKSVKETTAKERWAQAATERQKKHDEIERQRQQAAKQGKTDVAGAISRLEKTLGEEGSHRFKGPHGVVDVDQSKPGVTKVTRHSDVGAKSFSNKDQNRSTGTGVKTGGGVSATQGTRRTFPRLNIDGPELSEAALELSIGDPVIIQGTEYNGKTGDVKEFSPSGKFVVVELYNYGPQAFHLANVEYNQYADELDEEQDACYRKVKSRYKVWPSAYASGALVQCRKKGAANWGNKTKK